MKKLLSLIAVLLLVGCETVTVNEVTSYTVDATRVLNSYTVMKSRMSELDTVIIPTNVSYTDAERERLQVYITEAIVLADKVKTLIPHDASQITQSIITYASLDNIAFEAKSVYKNIEGIVKPRMNEYSESQQLELKLMSSALKNANIVWTKIQLKKSENMDDEVVQLLSTVIDLAAASLVLYDTAKQLR